MNVRMSPVDDDDDMPEGPLAEVLEAKRWLRRIRAAPPKMTQVELAARMGLTSRAVINAESLDNASLPRGLPFLRMLQALGAVIDAPQREGPSLEDRLATIEARVAATHLLAAEAVQLQASLLGDDARARDLEAEIRQLREDHRPSNSPAAKTP